ncbi:hypothetical protein [Aquimarina macrocephali]|uniref:hypothetical protein n=1 Tax=Aquimarina macrocephali TaxID=666563 RepID=UPI003F66FDCA
MTKEEQLEDKKRILIENECKFRYKGQRYRIDSPEPKFFRAVHLICNDQREEKQAHLTEGNYNFARGNYYYLQFKVYICGQHMYPMIYLEDIKDIEIVHS